MVKLIMDELEEKKSFMEKQEMSQKKREREEKRERRKIRSNIKREGERERNFKNLLLHQLNEQSVLE